MTSLIMFVHRHIKFQATALSFAYGLKLFQTNIYMSIINRPDSRFQPLDKSIDNAAYLGEYWRKTLYSGA